MNHKELGLRAIEGGDYQEAVNIFKRALEKKRDAGGMLGLATAYHMLGNVQSARWAFNKVLELDAHNEKALTGLKELENKTHKRKPKKIPGSLFRAKENYFELYTQGKWTKVFIKGINIGLGLPGYFPGEYAIGQDTYRKWFRQIAELGVNAIRIYTIHPPSFYQAFREFNDSEKRMHLFQGIWAELPEKNDFDDGHYRMSIKDSIRNAVDAIYGNANLPEKPGHASGVFDHDVSRYTAGFIFGREWESCAVKKFNESRGRERADYQGNFLQIANGTPFEMWLTKTCDLLQSYEYKKYRLSHPVSAVNWPTLDPIEHPSESPYEEELLFQGIKVPKVGCNENEDMESVDFSKITAHQGSGVFATSHVYPSHPDFMSHDYLDQENPYLTYLMALKRRHGRQPVLIAEFGMSASRDTAHWHRSGWNHGGHGEARQGEISSLLLKAIHKAGMAGGVLFSWLDEWFKGSWLFRPYELPAERRPLWFNFQDPEQNYGLLAAHPGYPGKRVSLSGRREEWSVAEVMYEKKGNTQSYKFNDGFDNTRSLVRLLSQHDEGFLYIMLEAKGKIDFSRSHYLIGLDTCCSDFGERQLPFRTKLRSPVSLTFLIHLAGKERSRILVARSYDKALNAETGRIRPAASDDGAWVMMQNLTNRRRISKDGKTFYPAHVFTMSRLVFGSLDRNEPSFHSLSDFFFRDAMIELRVPWGLLNFTDPSSRTVLWMGKEGMTRETKGVRMFAVSYRPEGGGLPARLTGQETNHTDSLPHQLSEEAVRTYTWEGWNSPVYHTCLKESYYRCKKVFAEIPERV